MLEVRNILKRRKGFLIRADFIVKPGEFLALKGRSGSGKTTVLRAIAGLEQIDSGEIFRNGSAINHQPPEKRCFGLVLQNPSLFFHLDMVDNITFGLKARGIKRNQRIQTALSLLNRLGLLHLKDAQVENLSGGEQRRIALLRAICWSPQALLLDEPFTGLDQTASTMLINLLEQAQAQGRTIVMVTHQVELALQYCDRLLVLSRGQLQYAGQATDFSLAQYEEILRR